MNTFNLPPHCTLRDVDPDPRDEDFEDGIEREQYESEKAYQRELDRQWYQENDHGTNH